MPDRPDVAALAAALVTVEARRIEAVSPNLLKHIPGPDMALWAEHAEAIIAALAAQGWRITFAPDCACGHPLIRHSEYGCWDCGTAEASTPQHNFSNSWRAWSRQHSDEQQAAEDDADARKYRSPEQVDEYVGEAVRAALEGLRAEVAADDEPYLSAEWLLGIIDARLAALDE